MTDRPQVTIPARQYDDDRLTDIKRRLTELEDRQIVAKRGGGSATWSIVRENALLPGPGIAFDGQLVGFSGNTILTYHATGLIVSEHQPDQGGLIAALSSAVSGDIVVCPKQMVIQVTSGLTVPAGVTLAYANLAASGFSGVVLTLGTGAVAWQPRIRYIASGSSATGILADNDDCIIYEPDVEVSGGSSNNIALGLGQTVEAKELWLAPYTTANPAQYSGILFSQDAFSGGSVHWYRIPLPSNMNLNNLNMNSSGHNFFQIDQWGAALYVLGSDTTTNHWTFWELSNLAAIRADPALASSPTWTKIVEFGADSSAPQIHFAAGHIMNAIQPGGALRFMCSLNGVEGEQLVEYYNGTSSTRAYYVSGAGFESPNLGHDFLYSGTGYPETTSLYMYRIRDGVLIGGAGGSPSKDGNPWVWNRPGDESRVYSTYVTNVSGTNYNQVVEFVNNATVISNLDTWTLGSVPTITGAFGGPQVYVVKKNSGGALLSDDGLNFSALATWRYGVIYDKSLRGGGSLVWSAIYDVSLNNPVARLYDRSGNVLADLTGDFWSKLSSPLSTRIMGAMVVY